LKGISRIWRYKIPFQHVAAGIRPRLSLFGSALREDIGPTSDVDVLVEFEPGHIPGLAFFFDGRRAVSDYREKGGS
jgi:predicted nucleotidyltransferase